MNAGRPGSEPPSQCSKTIFIVEDDHDTRVCLRQSLESEGYRVLSAANGAEALRTLEHIEPSLIVLDLLMPVMDGDEFLKVLSTRPRLRRIPVLLLSAYPDLASKLVARDFLQKPVQLTHLLERVSDLARLTA